MAKISVADQVGRLSEVESGELVVGAAERPEEISVAAMWDAIGGPGTAESMWSGEDLEEARKPWQPPTAGGFGRHVRLKVGPSGLVSLAHPDAPLGRGMSVRVVQINSVPPSVSDAEVVRLYSATVDASDSPMWEFERIGVGRILR